MNRFYRRYGKRVLDLAVCLPVALVLSPLMAATAVVVRWTMGPPAIFRQQRGGQAGETFTLYKFRTMRPAGELPAGEDTDEARLTRTGRFLRALSLDEFPQLWNVLRGDMSLVGPRPLLASYLDRYTAQQARRHEVLPGITGWAQVSGRNALSWERKFEFDVWYVDHVSFLLDLKILALTLARVLLRRGIDAEGRSGMPEFTGENSTHGTSPGGPH